MTVDPDPHIYLSTSCLHEEAELAVGNHEVADALHAYCAGETGACGAKEPAKCKFCDARCVCPRHEDPSALPR